MDMAWPTCTHRHTQTYNHTNVLVYHSHNIHAKMQKDTFWNIKEMYLTLPKRHRVLEALSWSAISYSFSRTMNFYCNIADKKFSWLRITKMFIVKYLFWAYRGFHNQLNMFVSLCIVAYFKSRHTYMTQWLPLVCLMHFSIANCVLVKPACVFWCGSVSD